MEKLLDVGEVTEPKGISCFEGLGTLLNQHGYGLTESTLKSLRLSTVKDDDRIAGLWVSQFEEELSFRNIVNNLISGFRPFDGLFLQSFVPPLEADRP